MPVWNLIVQPLFSLEDKLVLAKFLSVYFYVYLLTISLGQLDKTSFKWGKALIYTNEGRLLCDPSAKDSDWSLSSAHPTDEWMIRFNFLFFILTFFLTVTLSFKLLMKVFFFINTMT